MGQRARGERKNGWRLTVKSWGSHAGMLEARELPGVLEFCVLHLVL